MTDELPPLPRAKHYIAPYPESNLSWFWVYDKSGGRMEQSIPVFTADQMRAYAAASFARERERCAKVCEDLAPKEPNCVWESAYKHVGDECAAAIRRG